jgi:hypothetical protein
MSEQRVTVETHTRVEVEQSQADHNYTGANIIVTLIVIGLGLAALALGAGVLIAILPMIVEALIELVQGVMGLGLGLVQGVMGLPWAALALVAAYVSVGAVAIFFLVQMWHAIAYAMECYGIARANRRAQQVRLAESQRPVLIVVASQAEAQKLLADHNNANVRIVDAQPARQLQEVRNGYLSD